MMHWSGYLFIPHYKTEIIASIKTMKPYYTGLTKRNKKQLIAIYLTLRKQNEIRQVSNRNSY